jgi:diguanylate cyclase (GGDEF)-like protein/PAS domain S-box-containing protein
MKRSKPDVAKNPIILNEFTNKGPLLTELQNLQRRVAELEQIGARRRCAEASLKAIETRNRLLGDSAPMGILTVDENGNLTGINRKMREMLPVALAADSTGLPVFDILQPFGAEVSDDFRRCLKNGETVVTETSGINMQGEDVHLRFALSPVSGTPGKVSSVLAFVENITQQKRAEEDVRESEKRYRLLFQSAPIALIERDASQLKAYANQLCTAGVSNFGDYLRAHPQEVDHCIELINLVDYNDAFVELLEAEDTRDLMAAFAIANSEEFRNMVQENILSVLDGRLPMEREFSFVTLKGNKRSVVSKAIILPGYEATLSRIVIALLDVTTRKQAEELLRASEQDFRYQAIRDDLTGLYNQRYLYQSLDELIQISRINNSCLSLIFMDIDNFKQVVDSYGHLNGSRAIRQVAATIQGTLEEPAYAVAYAGDEFVVVLPGFNGDTAAMKALEIRKRMKRTVYLQDQGLEVSLRASFGIAIFPDDASEVNGLLVSADNALFDIKKNGKNAVARCGGLSVRG